MARIGVNALYLIPGGVGGTEIYLRNLLQALAEIDRENEYVVFTNRETGRDLVPDQPNFLWAPQPVRAVVRPWRILWEQTGLVLAVKRHRIDVLFNPGFTTPIVCSCPRVTVFHDLQHKRHPEHFRWFDLPFWRLLLWAAVRSSSKLIADSTNTRDDLLHFYGAGSEIVLLGVERQFFEIAAARRPGDYILCVSTLHPHKNLDRLLRVYSTTDGLPQLVITGLKGFAAKEIEQLAGNRVRITGWIPREELYELFRVARAFIYPSTFEGFGLPVLEAMAAGVPVACSNIPPLREIAGSTVRYFDPASESAIRDALWDLVRNPDQALVDAARRRASEFAWVRTAQATLKILLSQI